MSVRLRPRFVAVSFALLAGGCGLFTSLDGLSGSDGNDAGAGAAEDAGDASVAKPSDGGAGGSDAGTTPSGCACPAGTQETNGICVVVAPSASGYACAAPVVAPACALTYEAELCAAHVAFPFSSTCGGKSEPSVFFQLGPLPGSVPDGGLRKWIVKSTNTDVLSRTNAACTQGVDPCASGPGPGGELTPGGATVAWGKTVASGCSTVRLEVQAY